MTQLGCGMTLLECRMMLLECRMMLLEPGMATDFVIAGHGPQSISRVAQS